MFCRSAQKQKVTYCCCVVRLSCRPCGGHDCPQVGDCAAPVCIKYRMIKSNTPCHHHQIFCQQNLTQHQFTYTLARYMMVLTQTQVRTRVTYCCCVVRPSCRPCGGHDCREVGDCAAPRTSRVFCDRLLHSSQRAYVRCSWGVCICSSCEDLGCP